MQIYGIKESIYIRKEFNSCRTVLGYQYGHRDVTWKRPKECFHRTSCPPYSVVSHDNETVGGILVLQILSFLLFLEKLHSCWARVWKGSIEYFHSCGEHLCKFIGTKGSVCIRKEFNSQRIFWDTNMAAVSLFWDTNMAPWRHVKTLYWIMQPSQKPPLN